MSRNPDGSMKRKTPTERYADDGSGFNMHTPSHVLGHKPTDHLDAMQALLRASFKQDEWQHEQIRFDGPRHAEEANECVAELKERGWLVTRVRSGPRNETNQSRSTTVEYQMPREQEECAA